MNRGTPLDAAVFCIKDLQQKAKENLSDAYREYFDNGAMDMITLHDNEATFDRYKLRPRVLRDVRHLDTSATFLGQKVSFPFGFAPSGMHRLASSEGELATSRAAARAQIPMILSAYATESCEDVIANGKGNPYAIQVNFLKRRDITKQLLQRAEQAGYQAVFLTVDIPVYGTRLNEHRNSLRLPSDITWPNLLPGETVPAMDQKDDPLAYDAGVDWEEAVRFLRENCRLPVWLKGIYTPEDVKLAMRYGFDGVVISNHGGRQLDGVPSTLDALRDCAPVARGQIAIAIDGGIRRGTDIFKALALGADFCFAGRIPIWGLAYKGESGVDLAIQILIKEFRIAMAMCGCRSIREISPSHISVLQNDGVLAKI